MTRTIAIIVAVLAIAVGGYVFLTQSSDEQPQPAPAVEEPAAPAEEPAADAGAAVEEPAADDAAATDAPAETPAPADDAAAPADDAAAPADDAAAPAEDAAPAMSEPAPAGDDAAALDGAPESETPAVAEAAASLDAVAMAADIPMGNADAPITVIEYGSFTCPHCADFYGGVHGRLKTNYIDTGKVRFIHREVYFDRFGLWAGMVARCGGPLRYYGIVERIYGTQRDWIGAGENEEVIENLKKIGRASGLSNDQIDTCLQNEGLAETLVSVYQANAEADEINGTPTFMINGEKHPNMGYADFTKILDGLLAE